MFAYHYDQATGVYVGMTRADESPLEPGVYLIPAGAVPLAPPEIPEGMRARLAPTGPNTSDYGWLLEAIPAPEPEPVPEAPPVSDIPPPVAVTEADREQWLRAKLQDNLAAAQSILDELKRLSGADAA